MSICSPLFLPEHPTRLLDVTSPCVGGHVFSCLFVCTPDPSSPRCGICSRAVCRLGNLEWPDSRADTSRCLRRKTGRPLTQWNCASLVQKIRPLRTLQIKDDDQFLNRLESQLRYPPTSTYWVPRRCGLCILALALHHASSSGRRASMLFYLYLFRFPVPPVSVPSCISTLILVY